MQIFIDTASVSEIERWLGMGVIDGVTTNPSIMLKDGMYDMERGAKAIAALVDPLPTSVEVTTNDLDEMVTQAQKIASWAPNMVIKIPQITSEGIPCHGIISRLETEGIRVNATVTLSLGQVILAAKSGASYISIFAGRIADEGGDAPEVIRMAANWLEQWDFTSRLVIGSIRSVGDILNAAMAGAHVITIPPQFLDKMADHKFTRETVRQFTADAQKALEMMQHAAASGSHTGD
jgi:transaldolase